MPGRPREHPRALVFGSASFLRDRKGACAFHAVSSNAQHFIHVLPQLVRGKQGRFATDENGYLSHNVDELKLTLESDFALDGQLYMPEKGRGPVVLRSAGQASFLRL